MDKCISYKCLNKYDLPNNPYDQFGPNCCCDLVKPYCCNYYCNCCPMVPTGMMPPVPPVPPVPPLPPPVPPPPPGRIVIGEGIFSRQGGGSRADGTLVISFINSMIRGIGIEHNAGDPEIILRPNTMYEYSYRVEIAQLGDIALSQSFLTLSNIPVAGSIDMKNNTQLGPVVFMRSGAFITGNDPNQILQLEVVNMPGFPFNLTDATLMLEALQ